MYNISLGLSVFIRTLYTFTLNKNGQTTIGIKTLYFFNWNGNEFKKKTCKISARIYMDFYFFWFVNIRLWKFQLRVCETIDKYLLILAVEIDSLKFVYNLSIDYYVQCRYELGHFIIETISRYKYESWAQLSWNTKKKSTS